MAGYRSLSQNPPDGLGMVGGGAKAGTAAATPTTAFELDLRTGRAVGYDAPDLIYDDGYPVPGSAAAATDEDMELSCSRATTRCEPNRFSEPELERLFGVYAYARRRRQLNRFILLNIILLLTIAVLEFAYNAVLVTHKKVALIAITTIYLFLFVYANCDRVMRRRHFALVLAFVSLATIATAVLWLPLRWTSEAGISHGGRVPIPASASPSEGVWEMCWLAVCVHLLLPLPFGARVSLAGGITLAHTLVAATLPWATPASHLPQSDFFLQFYWRSLGSNILAFGLCHMVGCLLQLWHDAALRQVFLARKRFLAARLTYEEENAKLESLVRCLVPEPLVPDLRRDFVQGTTEWKVPLVIHLRNVSFLSVEVAGLSYSLGPNQLLQGRLPYTGNGLSPMSAGDAVKLMNELYSRFDQLGQDLGCYRVRLYTDEYLCLAGYPESRVDHARCCVELALSLQQLVNTLSEAAEVGLDVRTAVHTGSAYAAVIGQSRMSFDLLGDDVRLVRQLQSLCTPGRVLVSKATFEQLPEGYRGESGPVVDNQTVCRVPNGNGNGSSSSSGINTKLDTYYIRPRHSRQASALNAGLLGNGICPNGTTHSGPPKGLPRLVEAGEGDGNCGVSNPSRTACLSRLSQSAKYNAEPPFLFLTEGGFNGSTGGATGSMPKGTTAANGIRKPFKRSSTTYRDPLHQHMLTQLATTGKNNSSKMMLSSTSPDSGLHPITLRFREAGRELDYERLPDDRFGSSMVASMAVLVVTAAVHALVLPMTMLLLLMFMVAFTWIGMMLLLILASKLKCLEFSMQSSYCIRLVVMVTSIVFVCAVSQVNVFCCQPMPNTTTSGSSPSLSTHEVTSTTDPSTVPSPHTVQDRLFCPLPGYIAVTACLCLLLPAVFHSLSGLVRLLLGAVIIAGYSVVVLGTGRLVFTSYDDRSRSLREGSIPGYVTATVAQVAFLLLIVVSGRGLEYLRRLHLLWQAEVGKLEDESSGARDGTSRLLSTLLPHHVTLYFLDTIYRNPVGLYSQEYGCVGVLCVAVPAWCPLGLEEPTAVAQSIRLLNQVLCSFDRLLERPEMAGVVKVRSAGEAAWFAVGVDPQYPINDSLEKTQRLSTLLRLALAMKACAEDINATMLEERIKLRIGGHAGPAYTGVTGGSRPQFGLWGEAAAVASLVERCGQLGRVHVTSPLVLAGEACGWEFAEVGPLLYPHQQHQVPPGGPPLRGVNGGTNNSGFDPSVGSGGSASHLRVYVVRERSGPPSARTAGCCYPLPSQTRTQAVPELGGPGSGAGMQARRTSMPNSLLTAEQFRGPPCLYPEAPSAPAPAPLPVTRAPAGRTGSLHRVPPSPLSRTGLGMGSTGVGHLPPPPPPPHMKSYAIPHTQHQSTGAPPSQAVLSVSMFAAGSNYYHGSEVPESGGTAVTGAGRAHHQHQHSTPVGEPRLRQRLEQPPPLSSTSLIPVSSANHVNMATPSVASGVVGGRLPPVTNSHTDSSLPTVPPRLKQPSNNSNNGEAGMAATKLGMQEGDKCSGSAGPAQPINSLLSVPGGTMGSRQSSMESFLALEQSCTTGGRPGKPCSGTVGEERGGRGGAVTDLRPVSGGEGEESEAWSHHNPLYTDNEYESMAESQGNLLEAVAVASGKYQRGPVPPAQLGDQNQPRSGRSSSGSGTGTRDDFFDFPDYKRPASPSVGSKRGPGPGGQSLGNNGAASNGNNNGGPGPQGVANHRAGHIQNGADLKLVSTWQQHQKNGGDGLSNFAPEVNNIVASAAIANPLCPMKAGTGGLRWPLSGLIAPGQLSGAGQASHPGAAGESGSEQQQHLCDSSGAVVMGRGQHHYPQQQALSCVSLVADSADRDGLTSCDEDDLELDETDAYDEEDEEGGLRGPRSVPDDLDSSMPRGSVSGSGGLVLLPDSGDPDESDVDVTRDLGSELSDNPLVSDLDDDGGSSWATRGSTSAGLFRFPAHNLLHRQLLVPPVQPPMRLMQGDDSGTGEDSTALFAYHPARPVPEYAWHDAPSQNQQGAWPLLPPAPTQQQPLYALPRTCVVPKVAAPDDSVCLPAAGGTSVSPNQSSSGSRSSGAGDMSTKMTGAAVSSRLPEVAPVGMPDFARLENRFLNQPSEAPCPVRPPDTTGPPTHLVGPAMRRLLGGAGGGVYRMSAGPSGSGRSSPDRSDYDNVTSTGERHQGRLPNGGRWRRLPGCGQRAGEDSDAMSGYTGDAPSSVYDSESDEGDYDYGNESHDQEENACQPSLVTNSTSLAVDSQQPSREHPRSADQLEGSAEDHHWHQQSSESGGRPLPPPPGVPGRSSNNTPNSTGKRSDYDNVEDSDGQEQALSEIRRHRQPHSAVRPFLPPTYPVAPAQQGGPVPQPPPYPRHHQQQYWFDEEIAAEARRISQLFHHKNWAAADSDANLGSNSDMADGEEDGEEEEQRFLLAHHHRHEQMATSQSDLEEPGGEGDSEEDDNGVDPMGVRIPHPWRQKYNGVHGLPPRSQSASCLSTSAAASATSPVLAPTREPPLAAAGNSTEVSGTSRLDRLCHRASRVRSLLPAELHQFVLPGCISSSSLGSSCDTDASGGGESREVCGQNIMPLPGSQAGLLLRRGSDPGLSQLDKSCGLGVRLPPANRSLLGSTDDEGTSPRGDNRPFLDNS